MFNIFSRQSISKWIISAILAVAFSLSPVAPSVGYAQAVPQTILNLPIPGTQILPTAGFTPILIKGVNIHPDNPLRFDFIIDKGNANLEGDAYNAELSKLL